ncbi:MAG: dihydrodipicolinate synthase family protein, partial [Planctomycetia bacterium]|nr:dihydrodipicolinate synthase family protein [Planctomycetia bacterium]
MSDVLTFNNANRRAGDRSNRLSGIVTPVVTPLAQSDRLDLDTTSVLFDRLICGGVSGLFLLGTTGEFAGMSHRLRQAFVREASRIIDGRVPVYVGVSDTSFDESVELGRLAVECSATALVVTAPYYYRFPARVMRTYLTDLANAVPVPLILYNMPGNTKVVFDEETIKFVVDTPNFIGIKDSGGDLNYFA